MTDRALRLITGSTSPPQRSLAVTGGKGGVGKSTVAINLAVALAQQSASTLLVDSDLGMADLNLLLGVAPQKSLLDALAGTEPESVLVPVHGIHLLPALNGSYLLATLGPSGQTRILEIIAELMHRFDSLVIDVAAGIGLPQSTFGSAACDTIVVVNPEPLSMADAYACIKVLAVERKVDHVYVLPNRVTSPSEAEDLVDRLSALVARFLDVEITPLPAIPADPMVGESARIGVPLLAYRPQCAAARAFRQVERALARAPSQPSRPTSASPMSIVQGEYPVKPYEPRPPRDRLISEHVEIAKRIALRMARRCPDWISRDDLVAAGMLGLTEAAERYDGSRNEPFLVFAEKRIRGAVLDELRRGDIMPRRVRQLARRIGATIAELERKLGGPPSDEDIAAALGVPVENYRKDLAELVHVTVGALETTDDALLPTGAEDSPERQTAHLEAMRRIRAALTQLEQRDILILTLYYNEELTYTEIASVLRVTTSRVCQLHARGIARLRAEIERSTLAPNKPAASRTTGSTLGSPLTP